MMWVDGRRNPEVTALPSSPLPVCLPCSGNVTFSKDGGPATLIDSNKFAVTQITAATSTPFVG